MNRLILFFLLLIFCNNGFAEYTSTFTDDLNLPIPKPQTKAPRPPICKNCLWLGSGVHYLVFQQKPPLNVEPINYKSIGAPSAWSEFRFQLFDRVGLIGEFQYQSGANLKTQTLNLKATTVNWTYNTLGFDYRFKKSFRLFSHRILPRLLFSYQMHSMPFLQQALDKSFSIVPLKFNSLSVGAYFDILNSEKWHYFLTNRLQVPIQSQSNIKVEQGLSFDGTIGAIYHINPTIAWAFFWGGQYHSLKYQTKIDEGNYNLWTSKLNTLIGFYF